MTRLYENFLTKYIDRQMNMLHLHNKKYSFNAIVGYEIRSEKAVYSNVSLYGYEPSTKTSITRNNLTEFPYFYNSNTTRFLGNPFSQQGTIENYFSYYASGAYPTIALKLCFVKNRF